MRRLRADNDNANEPPTSQIGTRLSDKANAIRARIPSAKKLQENVLKNLEVRAKHLVLGSTTALVIALTMSTLVKQKYGAHAEAVRAKSEEKRARNARLREARLATAQPLRYACANLLQFITLMLDDQLAFRAHWIEHENACVNNMAFQLSSVCHFIVALQDVQKFEGLGYEDIWQYEVMKKLKDILRVLYERNTDYAIFPGAGDRLACALIAAAPMVRTNGELARLRDHYCLFEHRRDYYPHSINPLRLLEIEVREVGECLRDVAACTHDVNGKTQTVPSLIAFLRHGAEVDHQQQLARRKAAEQIVEGARALPACSASSELAIYPDPSSFYYPLPVLQQEASAAAAAAAAASTRTKPIDDLRESVREVIHLQLGGSATGCLPRRSLLAARLRLRRVAASLTSLIKTLDRPLPELEKIRRAKIRREKKVQPAAVMTRQERRQERARVRWKRAYLWTLGRYVPVPPVVPWHRSRLAARVVGGVVIASGLLGRKLCLW
ncbi:hypothetical protein PPROV_000541600 [Pycnococcus provasolii]|uniref:Uncharacterized protein n=1 Tax=Pycnococcus provasolii TaxID=41880 RepID=A0A830HM65_9CHLO|nr:hypothetical protein PPROV_000541600 [Pycnococcus provasolii]